MLLSQTLKQKQRYFVRKVVKAHKGSIYVAASRSPELCEPINVPPSKQLVSHTTSALHCLLETKPYHVNNDDQNDYCYTLNAWPLWQRGDGVLMCFMMWGYNAAAFYTEYSISTWCIQAGYFKRTLFAWLFCKSFFLV